MRKVIYCATVLALTLGGAAGSYAAADLHLGVGESKVLPVDASAKAALGNPEVASLQAVGDSEVLLTGRAAGSTHLVYVDAAWVKQNRTVTVELGKTRKAMIEIGVEILEVDSQSALKAGLNWGSLSETKSLQDSLSASEKAPPPMLKIGQLQREPFAASLQLLLDRGKARMLAKPRLLVSSGEEASFMAGGEIPYVTENKNGGTNVEFKSYGVKLNIQPFLESEGTIRSKVRAEVSGIDLQNGVAVAGVAVPALKTRWTETQVEVRPGSTLVIGGLIQDEEQTLRSGIPILSDIPILGALFRTTHQTKQQTELVIFLTPSVMGQEGG